MSSNYAANYYSFLNYQDAVYHFASGSSSGTATQTIGPAPTYLAALSSPAMDLSDAVGMKVSFKISYNFSPQTLTYTNISTSDMKERTWKFQPMVEIIGIM